MLRPATTDRTLTTPGPINGVLPALAALERGEEATTLRAGLESNREIGKAVGLLMAMHSIDDHQAFTMFSQISQEMNIKLAKLAAQVVTDHSQDRDRDRD